MGHILEKIKFFFFYVSELIYIIRLYSMGHILEKIKKKFLPFCMDIYYKAIVWVIFWRKLKNKFTFCMDIYCKAIESVIFWRKIIFFFTFLWEHML
jgi:hypothetical protein